MTPANDNQRGLRLFNAIGVFLGVAIGMYAGATLDNFWIGLVFTLVITAGVVMGLRTVDQRRNRER